MARSISSSSAAPQGEPPISRRAAQDAAAMAGYIADMASELASLASQSDLQMVAYFLNLARVEAEIRSRELGGRPIQRRSGATRGL
jgi:hypothetical protein